MRHAFTTRQPANGRRRRLSIGYGVRAFRIPTANTVRSLPLPFDVGTLHQRAIVDGERISPVHGHYVLHAIDRRALDHCLVAHRSAEPGHTRLLEAIGQRPLLDFGMRLGEASAAALAVPLLKAAAACHNGMATFAQAGVSSKSSS